MNAPTTDCEPFVRERSSESTAGEIVTCEGRVVGKHDGIEGFTIGQRKGLGIALGEPSKVTAHRLGLSVRTVEAYRGQLFERLDVRGMAEAVRIAVLAGLLDT